MRLKTLYLASVLGCLSTALHGQNAPANPHADSAKRIVQRFYDWYVPRAANPKGRDMIMGATRGPVPFDAELVRWLRIDSTARAKAKDEVDGLDGDPYLNAQDPCKTYTAQPATAKDSSFLVGVLGKGGCEAHTRPDIIVELGQRKGRWTILEFRDPNRNNEGTIPLLKQLHPKAK